MQQFVVGKFLGCPCKIFHSKRKVDISIDGLYNQETGGTEVKRFGSVWIESLKGER